MLRSLKRLKVVAVAVPVDHTTDTLLLVDRGGAPSLVGHGLNSGTTFVLPSLDVVLSYGYGSAGLDPRTVLVAAAADSEHRSRRSFPGSTAHYRRVQATEAAGDAGGQSRLWYGADPV